MNSFLLNIGKLLGGHWFTDQLASVLFVTGLGIRGKDRGSLRRELKKSHLRMNIVEFLLILIHMKMNQCFQT